MKMEFSKKKKLFLCLFQLFRNFLLWSLDDDLNGRLIFDVHLIRTTLHFLFHPLLCFCLLFGKVHACLVVGFSDDSFLFTISHVWTLMKGKEMLWGRKMNGYICCTVTLDILLWHHSQTKINIDQHIKAFSYIFSLLMMFVLIIHDTAWATWITLNAI